MFNKRFAIFFRFGLVLALLGSIVTPMLHWTASASAAPDGECSPRWTNSQQAKFIGTDASLVSVTAIAQDDVWAVGTRRIGEPAKTLIQHWNGQRWKTIPSPNTDGVYTWLNAVDGISTDDVWAVGSGRGGTLTLHWNGTKWRKIPSLVNFVQPPTLNAVVAISSDDVWAGGTIAQDIQRTLMLHWDGVEWSFAPSPDVGNDWNYINKMAAVSANDIWAVGFFSNEHDPEQTLILHYDGNMWQHVPSPNVGSGQNELTGVAAISANDVWALGRYINNNIHYALVLHWDGNVWSVHPLPNSIAKNARMGGIFASSASDIWAVGSLSKRNDYRLYILHWDGAAWTRDETDSSIGDGALNSVVALSATDVWAVGGRANGNQSEPLIVHYAPPLTRTSLLVPSQNAVVNKQKVKLDWQNVECATRYELVVKQDSRNGAIVEHQTALENSQFITEPLARDTKYVWHVRGCNDDGCGLWSKWRSFSIAP